MLTLSVYPSISRWKPELLSNCIPSILNNAGQNLPMNHASRSDTMFSGKPQYLTTCLKNNFATSTALHYDFINTKVAYLANRSTTMKIPLNPYASSNCVMKSIKTLTHGLSGTRNGCNNPAFFCELDLSCWQIRQVQMYSSTSWWRCF